MNTKYDLPGDRVKTFLASYHGLASQNSDALVASCADCHGYHRVLPSADTNSPINKIHLVETCRKCHAQANAEFSQGKIHVAPDGQAGGTDFGSRLNNWVRRIYLFLIFATIGAMFVHNGIIFVKKVAARLRRAERPVVRMSHSQRWQHFVLAASFIALAVTGFALKFPDSWMARAWPGIPNARSEFNWGLAGARPNDGVRNGANHPKMAEGEGFEPPVGMNLRLISSQVP